MNVLGLLELKNFWFENKKKWFCSDDEFDKLCKIKYYVLLSNYKQINSKNKYILLGEIILLDQIPRHIFRNKKESFDYDITAQNLVIKNLDKINLFSDYELLFFLMPLKHSEDIKIQKISIELWEQLSFNKFNRKCYKNALKHYQIIKKYDRFPKRNRMLERKDNDDEKDYLENSGRFI